MKKVRIFLFAAVTLFMGMLLSSNKVIKADETQLEPEDMIVINANSSGQATYVYDDIQYTKTREITISLNDPSHTLDALDSYYEVCEFIPRETIGTNTDKEMCSIYERSEEVNNFQLTGRQDGEKTLKIYFFTNHSAKIKDTSKTITKKIVLDTTGPAINLTQGKYAYVKYGKQYSEYGATCVDDSGNGTDTCEVTIEQPNLDSKKITYQTVRYSATDFLGNETIVFRFVMFEQKAKKANNSFLLAAIGGVVILALALGYIVIKNKEKQKNQSVL